MSTPIRKKILNSSVSSIFILLAFLVAVNFLASQNSVYFDLTQEKIYTTSEATKGILKDLKDEVSVNFYISKDLPSDLNNAKTQLADLMNQYQDIAGSKLKVSYSEPENTPEKVQELGEKGIPQIQFNVIEKDKYEVKQGFFGVEITSGKDSEIKREAIPNFSQQIPDNKTFFMNLINSVSNSANLSSIRSKNIIDRPLKDLDESKKNYWKFFAIFSGAILVDVYGVLRIMRRRKRNK